MSSDLRRSLRNLEQDVNALSLAPAAAVRARGEARRRRQAAATVGLVVLVSLSAVGIWTSAARFGGLPATQSSCGPPPTPTVTNGVARVVLTTTATRADRDAVEAKLRGWDIDPSFEDRAATWQRFLMVYCDEPDLIANTRPEQLPESYLIRVPDTLSFETLRSELGRMRGVATIIAPDDRSYLTARCSAATTTVDERRLEIFLTLASTPDQREAIASRLRSTPGIVSFRFLDHGEAYDRFKVAYGCQPDLIELTRPEQLPESFVVTLIEPSAGDTVRGAVADLPGVDTVIHPR